MAEKQLVKTNKNHGGKEFKSFFRYIGQVKAVRKKEDGTDNWVDQPIYEESITKTGKPIRKVQFNVETAMSNELRVELFGMEQEYVYPYSSKHKKASKVAWKDRLDKTKYPDDTYHYIDADWDKAEKLGELIKPGIWVEVKGKIEPNEFTTEDGQTFVNVKRFIDSVTAIEDGQEIKNGGETFNYVTDFQSPDFKEVNYINLQVGIKSTYQNEETGDTKVNGVFLAYGKDRSEPKDIELIVYQKESADGKKSLADAFGTLERLDFIEITGTDNNRATFTYVDVEEKIDEDDPFSDVDTSEKVTRKERVNTGSKKGLEVTGYVTNTLIRGFLTEEEIQRTATVTNDTPFGNDASSDPFDIDEKDPFAD